MTQNAKPLVRLMPGQETEGVTLDGVAIEPATLGISEKLQNRLKKWNEIYRKRDPQNPDDDWNTRYGFSHDQEGENLLTLFEKEIGSKYEISLFLL